MTRKTNNRYDNFVKYVKTSLNNYNPKSTYELLLAFLSSQVNADCCLLINKFEQILFKSPTLKEIKFSHTILKKALKQKKSCYIKNAIKDTNLKTKKSIVGNIFLSVICVVLRDETDAIIGALYLDRHFPEKEPFTEIDLKQAEEFVSNFTSIMISEGLEKKELKRFREDHGFEGMIGKSEKMLKVFEQIKNVAPTDSNVLLQGETGTGKELVARAIHKLSKRSENPFIAINCSAIPKDLLESELFGHEKGSFTGATSKRKGKFQLAHNGTLFLDEIGDMDISLQTKLLRVLQEGEIQSIGNEQIIKVDIRLITASSKDIIEEIRESNFRKELFYRINSFPIFIPPLRDRKDDIILLANHYISRYCERNYNYIPIPYFTEKAKEKLLSYSWEGNVRELQNTMENLSISCPESNLITDDQINFYPIEKESSKTSTQTSLKDISEKAECKAVRKALEKYNWNKAKVIAELNTTYPTLARIMEKYGLAEK
ncbi:MAG TPA: AAA family ATPase [Candidatus Cloacimonetes bacterium]|nr:AAA family ATPase [Candidatus Cloacimonadota bacterium]